jgi:hypothetical protein
MLEIKELASVLGALKVCLPPTVSRKEHQIVSRSQIISPIYGIGN